MSTQPYLGSNVSLASAEELRHRGIVDEDETLLALFDGVLLDENRRRIGGVALCDFIAITDRRLIMWARGFFNDTVDSFPLADVDVAKAETWDPWHGRVVYAFRLPSVAPRTRRIVVKGTGADASESERVVIHTLDYMPAEDVSPLANIIGWMGDQILAGVTGQTLIAAFVEQFPAPERPVLSVLLAQPEPPPPPPAPVEEPRRRWWQRKSAGAEELAPPSSGNLIASYESRRSAQPAGDGTPALPMTTGSRPIMPEQPSVYEMSRSLRLLLEAPRSLARSMRRAGEMMSGAGDLVSGLQDPKVRRNAMIGIYQAAAQQEAENGPLASVGPVVRAAVRFSEPLPGEEAEAQALNQSRRIQVRAAVRRGTPPRPEAPAPTPAPAPAAAEAPAAGPVRRSISVRRVEQPAPAAPAPEPAPELAPPPAAREPVRRIRLNRNGDAPVAQPSPVPAGVNEEE